jgi:molybdenum cofactor cytidylyltransferase
MGFHRSLFGDLRALAGDQGARSVLRANPKQIEDIELTDAGIVRDIDRQEDLPTS